MVNLNKILFIIEGRKAEPNLLKKICIGILGFNEEEIIVDLETESTLSLKDDKTQIYIKWIKNADVVKFSMLLDEELEQGLNDGITLGSCYTAEPGIEFSTEYMIIDADMHDKLAGKTKQDFLKELISKIKKLDNSHILISSPSIESFIDEDDIYDYKDGKYKEMIGSKYPNGLGSLSKENIIEKMIMNFQKFSDEDIDYDDQRSYSVETFSADKIKIRSLLFHIIAEEKFIYSNKAIEEYIKRM